MAVLARENLLQAWQRARANKGAAACGRAGHRPDRRTATHRVARHSRPTAGGDVPAHAGTARNDPETWRRRTHWQCRELKGHKAFRDPRCECFEPGCSILSRQTDRARQGEKILARQAIIRAVQFQGHSIAAKAWENPRGYGVVEGRETDGGECLRTRFRRLEDGEILQVHVAIGGQPGEYRSRNRMLTSAAGPVDSGRKARAILSIVPSYFADGGRSRIEQKSSIARRR